MKSYLKLMIILFTTFLWSCNYLVTDYELDTNPDYLSSMTLLEYIGQGKDTSLTLFGDAIKYAQLEEEFSTGNQTRIVPTNNAIRTVLLTAGVSRIENLSPNVVKGLFSYLSIPGMYRSIDMNDDSTVGDLAISGDSLYITRTISGTDRYRMSINNMSKLATVPIPVIRQDYLFEDGVAHVVDQFPVYQEIVITTDTVPAGVDYSEAEKDTIWLNEDSSVYFASKNNNYNTAVNQIVARANQFRHTFFKFNLKPVDFIDNLAFAQLNFFVNRINGSNYVPSCGVYETSTEWTAETLTWNTMPAFGQEVAVFDLGLDWNSTNISKFMLNAYENGTETISFGLRALNGADITSSSVQIRNMEASNGIYTAYISLMSSIESELQLDHTTPVVIGENGIGRLTKENISMSGPAGQYKYTDNNIIYVLIDVPTQGTLTKYGFPMIKYTEFTQEELAAGAIKYIPDGNNTADSFSLKIQDYIGGTYADIVSISVQ